MVDDSPPQRCGVIRVINGREWICIKRVHDDPPRPGHGQRSSAWYRGYPPKSERHYFRRRWPNSDR
jgi:hypothetical protein